MTNYNQNAHEPTGSILTPCSTVAVEVFVAGDAALLLNDFDLASDNEDDDSRSRSSPSPSTLRGDRRIREELQPIAHNQPMVRSKC
jgi:hypothetical protein